MINATSTEESNAVFRDASENLINRQLLLQEAARRKIAIPDGEVAERARQFQIAGGEGQPAPASSAPDAAADERSARLDDDREDARRRISHASRATDRDADSGLLRSASRSVREGSGRSANRAYRRQAAAQRDRRAKESGGRKDNQDLQGSAEEQGLRRDRETEARTRNRRPRAATSVTFGPGNCRRWSTRWCSRRRSGN